MDPKQTEGQGSGSPAPQGGFSFVSGQMNPTPSTSPTPPGAPNTLSTGASISRTMSDLNASDRKSATSNSPFAKHHFNKVAPQTGDILIEPSKNGSIISSSTEEKQGINRGRLIQFGLIFGGIALVGLVIFTVVMLINKPKTSTNNTTPNTPQVVTHTTKETFTEYMSMFVNNSKGSTDVTESWESFVYFYPMNYATKQVDAQDSTTRTEYLEALNQKWNDFISSYKGTYAKDASLDNVPFYFYYVALLPNLSEQSLYELYNTNDQKLDESKNAVSELVKNKTSSFALADILNMKKNLYDSTLDVINDAKNVGCLSSSTLFHSCDTSSLPAYAEYQKAANTYNTEFSNRSNSYKKFAFATLVSLCEEIFGRTTNSSDNTGGDL